jgi:SAM-dependent methyltransferase
MERTFYTIGSAKGALVEVANRDLGYSVRRRYIDEFYHHHVSALPISCTLLDVGGNKIEKRGQFDLQQYPLEVVYVNLSPKKKPHAVADAAICSEVLEHVPHPQPVLGEIWRVLQPGGYFFMSVPFLHPIHADPYDFGRYTDFYWQQALKQAGFENIHGEIQGGFHAVIVHQWKMYANRFVKRPFRQLAGLFFQMWENCVRWHESRHRIKSDSFLASYTTGFGFVARKSESIEES